MTQNMDNPALMSWFHGQQTPEGWFDLLALMVEGMVSNVGEHESQPFLRQMGHALAEQFPLQPSETVGELEANINGQLARFGWGCVDIATRDTDLTLRHQGLPVSRIAEQQNRWCHAFCAILEGLYAHWMQGQGGKAHVTVSRDRLFSISDVQFRYHNPQ